MALEIGNSGASSGLSKRIWDELSASGMPGAKQTDEDNDAYELRIDSLKKMCYSIAKGVVNEILDNLEIKGITVKIDSTVQTVENYAAGVGDQGGSLVAGAYPVVGSVKHGTSQNMVATQNNDGKGLVT